MCAPLVVSMLCTLEWIDPINILALNPPVLFKQGLWNKAQDRIFGCAGVVCLVALCGIPPVYGDHACPLQEGAIAVATAGAAPGARHEC